MGVVPLHWQPQFVPSGHVTVLVLPLQVHEQENDIGRASA